MMKRFKTAVIQNQMQNMTEAYYSTYYQLLIQIKIVYHMYSQIYTA